MHLGILNVWIPNYMHDLIKWSRAYRIWGNYEAETHTTQLYIPKAVLSSKTHKLVLYVRSAALTMLAEYLFPVNQISVLSAGLFCCFSVHVCKLHVPFLWHPWKTPGNVHSSFPSGNIPFTDHLMCKDDAHVGRLHRPALFLPFLTSAVTFPHFIYRNFSTTVYTFMLFCNA